MATNKKKLDEKHLKILREMVALSHNKQCFDCHQRGPTYINMTIGAFVCTACSGLLRGLNPPHRVKSISMASFTPEEMDFIKSHGNEFCRKVWLGLYDNRLGNQSESREENKVKDFMIQKYERKQFYVAPTDSMKEEAKKMNESAISKTPGTKPLKSLLGENAPKLQVNPQQKPVSATPPPIHATPTPQSPGNQSVQSSKSSGSTAMDLLGDLGGDPFASSAPPTQSTGGFADFGNFGSSTTSVAPPFAPSAPLQPGGSTPQQNAFNGFNTPAISAPPAANTANKYSNLSDLFNTSSTEGETSATGWSISNSSSSGWGTSESTTAASTSINWGGDGKSSGSSGINWGGESNSSGGSLNWGSSTPAQAQPVSTGWGATMSTQSSWGAPATAANAAANPFGGSSTTLTSQSTMGQVPGAQQPNPFGGNPMTSQAGGFGAFGQPAGMPQGAGFRQAAPTGAGFGQFGTQNGGFGQPVSTAAGFGQPGGGFGAQAFGGHPSGFGQQQAGFGAPGGFGGPTPGVQQGFGGQGFGAPAQPGWGQMPVSTAAVNPFMNTAQQYSAPKTGASNPFL